MPVCEKVERCPFFNEKMSNMPATAAGYKRKYCLGNNEQCARHIVLQKLGGDKVPLNLYPNQVDKAEKLIKEQTIVQ
nr:hypothetical protein [uncultured Carboxylicivirga sp.]